MKRRPILALALAIAAAAVLQAATRTKSPPDTRPSNVPAGTVCTVCGPIPTGACALPALQPSDERDLVDQP